MTEKTIILIIGLITGYLIGNVTGTMFMQGQAVKTPCAQYSPKTSYFEWIEPEKN